MTKQNKRTTESFHIDDPNVDETNRLNRALAAEVGRTHANLVEATVRRYKEAAETYVVTNEALENWDLPDVLETRSYKMTLLDGRRYVVWFGMLSADLERPMGVALRDMGYLTYGVIQFEGVQPVNLIWAIGRDDVLAVWPQGDAEQDEIVIQATFVAVKRCLGDFAEKLGSSFKSDQGTKTLH